MKLIEISGVYSIQRNTLIKKTVPVINTETILIVCSLLRQRTNTAPISEEGTNQKEEPIEVEPKTEDDEENNIT